MKPVDKPLYSKEEYLQIISTIKQPETKDEKFRFYLAIDYVRHNFTNLDKNELTTVMRHDSFVKALGKDFEGKLTEHYTNLSLENMDKQKCVNTFRSSNKPVSKDDKYQFHLAFTYFKQNFMSFDAQDLKDILGNDYVKLNSSKKFDKEIMEKCILDNKSFPITLPKWKDGSIAKATIISYLDILLNENNEEQLKFFVKHRQYEFRTFVEQKDKIPPMLENIYLELDHQYIFRINWSEEKKCDWLKQNKNLAVSLFGALYLYESYPNPKLKTMIFEEIKDKLFDSDFSDNNIYHKRSFLSGHNTEFVSYIEKKYPNELKEVLAKEIKSDALTWNFAQDLIFCSINFDYGDSAKKLYQVICDNKELLLKPIKVENSLYEKEISFFEHGLNNSNFFIFCPFNLNTVVDNEHKEQLLAAAFCLLQTKYNAYNNYDEDGDRIHISNYEHLKSWYPTIIDQATPEQIVRYADRAAKGNTDNTKFIKLLESLKLKADLNTDLSNDNVAKNAKVKL